MSTVGIGIIGTGWWATQFHIPGVLSDPRAHLAGIADRDEDRLDAARAAYEPSLCTTDHHELLASPDVSGVIIATPHSTHYELARDALQAGKHVLVEKPLTLSAAEARALVELAAAEERALLIGHTYHHTRHAERVREVVSSGAIGEVTFVSALFASMAAAYYRGAPEEYDSVFNFPVSGPAPETYSNPEVSGGGQGWTQVTHLMDMVFWVTGLRAERVFARMESRDLPVDLIDSMSFRLSNGGLGTAGSTGQLLPGQEQQQEIRYYGTKGYVLQELIHGELAIFYNDGREERPEPLSAGEIYPAEAPSAALIHVCSEGFIDKSAAASAVATVEFLETAYKAALSGLDERVVVL